MTIFKGSPMTSQVSGTTIRLSEDIDVDLSDYVDFTVDDSADYFLINVKIGDMRIGDPDGSDDYFHITVDPASGSLILVSSCITDKNLFEIDHNGTISGASAPATINEIVLDGAGLTLDDNAANAITLMGLKLEWGSITPTAITLSELSGIDITMPTTGAYNAEYGIHVKADKGDAANGAVALLGSRDIAAVITADRAYTDFGYQLTQTTNNTSAGDFDISDAAASGVLKLVMNHTAATTVGAKTDPDICQGKALYIECVGTVNDANTKLDYYPKAIDIVYTFTETAGTLRMAATDIIKITPTIPNGLSSAGAFEFNVQKFNLDNVVLNDGNITFNGFMIDASGLTNTSSANARLISLKSPNDSNIDDVIYIDMDKGDSDLSADGIDMTRDVNAAITADRSISGWGVVLSQNYVNNSAGDFDLADAADSGVLQLILSHTATTSVGAKTDPDTFQGTVIKIDIDAVTDDANTKLDATPRAIDINYLLTETAGTLRWGTTDIIRIDFGTSGTLSSAGASTINMIDLDAVDVTIDDSNVSLNALNIDMSTLTLTDASSLHGIQSIIPTLVGQATTRYAMYASDGSFTAKMVDGSMGMSATGINDEKYYRCEDFDEEAAAVTLDAGVRGDEWTFGGTNGDAGDVTYIQGAGGLIRMETDGADNDSIYALWLNTAVYTTANPIIEFRVKIDAITASLSGFAVGLAEAGAFTTMSFDAVDDDYILVGMDSDLGTPANLRMYTEDNNGGITTIDTGVAIAANTWCTIRIDCTDTEQPRLFINNSGGAITPSHEVAAGTITGTIQAGIYMYPVLFLICLDATPSARHLDVDYIKIWQDRA